MTETVTVMTQYQPTRGYRTRVSNIQVLTPHFVRITVQDDELAHFGTQGLDQRIKLILPLPDGSAPDVGLFAEPRPSLMEWYGRWRALADGERNPIRTYTARAIRPEVGEVDIDFVLHGRTGPASVWAMDARVGDELVVVGPDGRATAEGNRGVEWQPGGASDVLLVGDETAVPAISSILESLAPRVTGHAFMEVPEPADFLDVASPSGVEQHWLARTAGEPAGSALVPAVLDWGACFAGEPDGAAAAGGLAGDDELSDPAPGNLLWDVPTAPDASFYAWLAGEAGVITTLRRHLVRDLGVDRKSVAFMGYWREGRPES